MPFKVEEAKPRVDDGDRQLQRFIELRKLGQGNYGKVQLALNRATNEEVAVKTIKKEKINSERAMKRIHREIHIMSSIRHPHIIHIEEVFETRQSIIIIMQYASGGELYEYLLRHETLPDDEARRIFRQIVSAVYYCHKNKICHRDLKLENILLDSEGNAQIGDFGLSNTFDDEQTTNTSCGSPLYASPEIVNGLSYKGPEVDCWSLGVLLYTLVYGTMPFLCRNFRQLVMQITEGRYTEPDNKSSASSLIRRLLTPAVSKRATIVDVCEDPWMSEGYSLPFLQEVEKMSRLAGRPQNKTQQLFGSSTRSELFVDQTAYGTNAVSKHPSLVPENPDTVLKKNKSNLQKQSGTYDEKMQHDVLSVINKLLDAVEMSLTPDKTKSNSTKVKARVWNMKKNEKELEKVDSAFVIPIFDVTSTIPYMHKKQINGDCFKSEKEQFPVVNTTNFEENSSVECFTKRKKNQLSDVNTTNFEENNYVECFTKSKKNQLSDVNKTNFEENNSVECFTKSKKNQLSDVNTTNFEENNSVECFTKSKKNQLSDVNTTNFEENNFAECFTESKKNQLSDVNTTNFGENYSVECFTKSIREQLTDVKTTDLEENNSVENKVVKFVQWLINRQELSRKPLPAAVNGIKLDDVPEKPVDVTEEDSENVLTKPQKSKFPLEVKNKKKKQLDRVPSTNKYQSRKKQEPALSVQTKDNDIAQKRPTFSRTKNHVMNLARLLSLNYEKLKQNSVKIPLCKKKPPGKLTIPPTFNSSSSRAYTPVEKKELFIFPTVSVSENKAKIQKKIEKIKKAALDKNLIIRSDSKTRLRIENFIKSQVRQIQNLVSEEQRSNRASFDNFDEQSLRNMYYRTFGSENTDSGIVSTEDEDYFCFLCSKPTNSEGTFLSSTTLDNIKKECLYASNHLHIPSQKRPYNWRHCAGNGMETGTLSRCKSEIHLPVEYLNYISTNKSALGRRTFYQQKIKNNNIDLSQFFFSKPSLAKTFNPNNFVLRSASDSVGLNINNSVEIVKLNIDNNPCRLLPNTSTVPHFLKHVSSSSECDPPHTSESYSAVPYPDRADHKVLNSRSSQLLKDDGIGNSNESFQSCMETRQRGSRFTSEFIHSRNTCDSTNAKEQIFMALSKQLLSETGLYPGQAFKCMQPQKIQKRTNSIPSIDALVKDERKFDKLEYVQQSVLRCYTAPCMRVGKQEDERSKSNYVWSEIEKLLWNACKADLYSTTTGFAQSPANHCWNSCSDRKPGSENFSSNHAFEDNSLTSQTLLDCVKASNPCEKTSSYFENILMQLSSLQDHTKDHKKHLSRAKSLGSAVDSETYEKMKEERRLSQSSSSYASKQNLPASSKFDPLSTLDDTEYDRVDHKLTRKPASRNALPRSKTPKPKKKKSFLHLLALKRIQEAEKELKEAEKPPELEIAEENPGSLLEALKTHGYKSVISQRFQNNDDYQDPYFTKRVKTAEQVRAEVARLNYMYYDSLPSYTVDPYTDPLYIDYTTGLSSEPPLPSFYNLPFSVSQTPKQSVYDWLNTIQTDEYSPSPAFAEASYKPVEMVPYTNKSKSRRQWVRDSSLEDSSPSDTTERLSNVVKHGESDRYEARLKELDVQLNTDDEKEESVKDRIWRKSFYSRFNDRALSRRMKSPFVETEFSSESRLGQLNGILGASNEGISRFDGYSSLRSSKRKKSLSHVR